MKLQTETAMSHNVCIKILITNKCM